MMFVFGLALGLFLGVMFAYWQVKQLRKKP